MAAAEKTIQVDKPPAEATQACALALTRAGFKNVSAAAGIVTAQKKAVGQWNKSQITIALVEQGDGTRVTVTSQAVSHSLVSLASSPAERLVEAAVQAIEEA